MNERFERFFRLALPTFLVLTLAACRRNDQEYPSYLSPNKQEQLLKEDLNINAKFDDDLNLVITPIGSKVSIVVANDLIVQTMGEPTDCNDVNSPNNNCKNFLTENSQDITMIISGVS